MNPRNPWWAELIALAVGLLVLAVPWLWGHLIYCTVRTGWRGPAESED